MVDAHDAPIAEAHFVAVVPREHVLPLLKWNLNRAGLIHAKVQDPTGHGS